MSGWWTASNARQSRALKRSSPFVMSASRRSVRLVFRVVLAMTAPSLGGGQHLRSLQPCVKSMFDIVDMLVTHLEGIDLNLLPPLAALLEERHVTRAAERSGLSQPAMSRTLARLRRLLDDQLLVRDGSGYVLTPRAERIQRQLGGLMPQLETLFAAEVFDPATAEEHYHVAATDYALLLFLHQVAREVNRLSPQSALRIESPGDGGFDDLHHGRLDLS